MWIVAIAWIYVVGLMAVTEPSIVAGVMTFVGYCVIPLSILFYLTGGKRRRAKREAAERDNSSGDTASARKENRADDKDGDADGSDGDSGDSSGGGDD